MEEDVLISISSFMVDRGVKLDTVKKSVRNIRYFLSHGGEKDPSAWFRDFMKRDVSDSYKYQMYYSIKWFLRYKGIEWDFKRPKQHKKVRQNLSIEKCWALLEHLENEEHKLMVETALLTGLRPSELLALKVEDIDFFEHTILVKSTKTYQDRIIPIGKELSQKLQYWIYKKKISNRIFPYNPDWFAVILRKASKKIGFHVTPYMLRHTFATQYIENGGNLLMLKNILGHSNIKTTESYVHESKAMLRKDYERAKPRLFV